MSNHNPPTNGFTKGSPRINRLGRPKNFDALRSLAKLVLDEKIVSKDGTTAMSRVELMIREMASSRDPRKMQSLLDIAYGKVPQAVDVSLSDKVIVEIVRETAEDSPETVARQATSD